MCVCDTEWDTPTRRGWEQEEEEGGQSRSKPCHLFRVLSKIRLANLVLFSLQNATGRLFTLR